METAFKIGATSAVTFDSFKFFTFFYLSQAGKCLESTRFTCIQTELSLKFLNPSVQAAFWNPWLFYSFESHRIFSWKFECPGERVNSKFLAQVYNLDLPRNFEWDHSGSPKYLHHGWKSKMVNSLDTTRLLLNSPNVTQRIQILTSLPTQRHQNYLLSTPAVIPIFQLCLVSFFRPQKFKNSPNPTGKILQKDKM